MIMKNKKITNRKTHEFKDIQFNKNGKVPSKPKSLIPPRSTPKPTIPEKEKFHNLLKTENEKFCKSIHDNYAEFHKWFIDKDEYLQKLKNDQKSIESCNSSLTSDVCTNFTNDSGSVLLIGGNRSIPFDYLTKPNVPFDKLNRSSIKAIPFTAQNNEHDHPYYAVPFSGQMLIMRELYKPKDKFYTNAVRARYDIRDRINVDEKCVQFAPPTKSINTEDEVEEKKQIVPSKEYRFKRQTYIAQARETLRHKIHAQYIQEHLIEKIMVQDKELSYAKEVIEFKNTCEPIFSKLQEKHYRQYMRKIQSLKPFYDKTSRLEKQLKSLQDETANRIISEEDCWRERVVMQNFHYLLKDMEWRERNDWIHSRQIDGSFETYRESIRNRYTVNLRDRATGTNSVWEIKEFYEKWSSRDYQKTVVIVFPTVQSFLIGVVQLKASLFKSLLQLHFYMWVHANLEHELRCFGRKSEKYLLHRRKYVHNKCTKKDFLDDRIDDLHLNAYEWTEEPLMDKMSEKLYRTVLPLCKTTMKSVFPNNFQNDIQDNAIIDSMTCFVNLVMDLFEQRDRIPSHIRKYNEKKIQMKRSFEMRRGKRMCALEMRLINITEQLKKNLAPPYKRPKRVGKLPRSELPKRKIIVKKDSKPMAELDKLYYKAFVSGDHLNDVVDEDPAEMEILKSLETNCIPYYFDHFLKCKGYFPVYDFKTDIETAEGIEEANFRYDDVLDDVLKNLNHWMTLKQDVIKKNILRTFYLYENDPN